MVDATQAMESMYLNADFVKGSNTKIVAIINAGEYQESDYGTKLTFDVEIDHKKKIWRPNKDTCCNIADKHGVDTTKWIGQPITLTVIKVMGKDSILGVPV